VDILRPHQPCYGNGGRCQAMCSKEKMNRRTFLKLIGIGGAAALAPPSLFAHSDVYGWRFGVWTLLKHYGTSHVNPDTTLDRVAQKYYWCRCDCGAEQVVGLRQLLRMDALSCDHVRVRGYFCLGSDAMYCQNCGGHRRFYFRGDGLRIWRCSSWCEAGDVYPYLRKGSSPESSIQFLANMRKMPEDCYDRFLRTLRTKIIAIMRRDQTTLRRIEIDPPTEHRYRLVRIWTDRHPERPLTFYHPY